jgi:hypothetical protein
MIHDLISIRPGLRPQPTEAAASDAAGKAAKEGGSEAGRGFPEEADLAFGEAGRGLPAAPGLGGKLDIYDTVSAGDFPYLEPLTGLKLGSALDTSV